jgi:hypothetical protein
MADLIGRVFDWLSTSGERLVRTWCVVIGGPSAALATVADDEETFKYGLKFLLAMSIVCTFINVPAVSLLKWNYASIAFLSSTAADDFVSWLFYGLIGHLSFRAFGGTASLRHSLSLFCFATAFLPLLALAELPAMKFSLPIIREGRMFPDEADLTVGLAAMLVVWLASTLVLGWMFRVVFLTMSRIHGLHGWRKAGAGILSLAALVAAAVLITGPMTSLLLNAFA